MEFLPGERPPQNFALEVGAALLDGWHYAAVRAMYVDLPGRTAEPAITELAAADTSPDTWSRIGGLARRIIESYRGEAACWHGYLESDGEWPPVLPRWQASGPGDHDITSGPAPAPAEPVARTTEEMAVIWRNSPDRNPAPDTVIGSKDCAKPRFRIA